MPGTSFDLIVIGGGPGGYVAAIRAAQLGMDVALVEREHLGGVCLNWGCIPTKALLRTADIIDSLKHAADFGIDIDIAHASYDAARVVKRSRDVAGQMALGVKSLLRRNKVQVFDGRARLAGRGALQVEGKDGAATLQASHIILATGARPRSLPGLEPDGRLVWTSKEAMVPPAIPKSLLVIGSGAIGVEFASFYRSLGSEVTVVELLPQILPVEDEEIAAVVRKQLEKRGIAIHTSATVSKLERGADSLAATIRLADGTETALAVERAILAVGVQGNVEDLGMETTAMVPERSFIPVGPYQETAEPGIYAIGDVAGPPCLAHKASHEGIICVEHIAGLHTKPLDRSRIPGCTYGNPQVASVGLTEKAAREKGYALRVGKFPFLANGKAVALGEPEGLVKTIFDAETGQLLGAHLTGPEVTELIHGYVVAMNLETTEDELLHSIYPHPTLSEAMHESVLNAYGRSIHI